MGLILGLDLGIASVGYGIIDENYNIIDYGVRLFDEADAKNNRTRRDKRSSRRLKSRKQNRIKAIKYYLKQIGIIDSTDFEHLNDVYELRVKGLTEKLSDLELANVIVNIAKHRGVFFEVISDEENNSSNENLNSKEVSSALYNNTQILKRENLYVCQLQLRYLKENSGDYLNKLRGSNNVFHSDDYKKELKKILENQELSQEQIDKILNLVFRKRDFSEGPGSEKFPTPYGSYRIIGDSIVHVNLIEEMRGKCSIFPDEPRIAKNTFKACLFNLLNDLNNLTLIIDGQKQKISTEQKQEVIEFVKQNGSITPKKLCNLLQVSIEDVSGFRIDKNGKPLLTSFDAYQKVLKLKINLSISDFDKIIEVLTKTLVKETRVEELKALKLDLTDEDVDALSCLTKINGYHSLSEKAMNILIKELLETNDNQMQIIQKNNLVHKKIEKGCKDILFDETAILSPVVVRVQKQALKIVNALRRKYGEFDSIIIETTRAKNSKEERDNINKEQKFKEDEKKKVDDLILEMEKDPSKFNNNTKLKLRLYKEQDGKTMYSGEPIDLETLINYPNAYEIEHIIPYSISFDNSLNNKALASHKENQDKKNLSPFAYFASGMVDGPIDTWEKFESRVNSMQTISSKKKKNLLNQDDINKYDELKEFSLRNLTDTSYAIRIVMNTLQTYFKINNCPTKVFTIKGKITGTFRNRVGLEKNRDEFIHHAVDALIIAGFHNQKTFFEAFKLSKKDLEDDLEIVSDLVTGEVFASKSPLDDSKLLEFIKGLKRLEVNQSKFSYKIDTKTNRQFSDQTIYSTREYDGKDYLIKKYKDIYGPDGIKIKENILDPKKREKFLVYKNDIKTFELLEKIVKSYPNESNPFAAFKKEHGYIRKYSKNNNGPIIRQIKYIDSELGYHMPIKTETVHHKKVVLLKNSAYRTDFYQDETGHYKFLTVRRYHIKQIGGKNVIDPDLYQNLKKQKKITENAQFLFSLYRNNIIQIVDDKDEKYYKFIATNNDTTNRIEVRNIERKTEKQTMLTIGKKTQILQKFNVSVIGEYSKVEKEVLKLQW